MECPKCGDQNQDGLDEICSACGEALNECPNCGYNNPLLAQKCTNCGADLISSSALTAIPATTINCPKCGHENPETAEKCTKCGAILQPRLLPKKLGVIFGIVGAVCVALIFGFPIVWKWEPYTEITLATGAALFLRLYFKSRKEMPFWEIIGWRMWYVYAIVVGLLIAIAAR